jgi:predicted alpha/beta hydrolase
MKDVFGKSLGGGVFGAAAEETRVVFFFIFGLNAVRLLAEYSKA